MDNYECLQNACIVNSFVKIICPICFPVQFQRERIPDFWATDLGANPDKNDCKIPAHCRRGKCFIIKIMSLNIITILAIEPKVIVCLIKW